MQKIKNLILSICLLLVRLIRCFVTPTQVILVTSDIPRSNMGDQALMLGAIKGIKLNYSEDLTIIPTGTESVPTEYFPKYFSNTKIQSGLSIVFMTDQCFRERLSYAVELIKSKKVYYVGADILDGTYETAKAHIKLNIMNKTKQAGVPVKVVSFSLSEEVSPLCVDEFKKLEGHELCVRDPKSALRVEKFTQCEVGSDCAFLMDINDFDNPISPKLEAWLAEQTSTIAISFKTTDIKRFLDNGMTLKAFSDDLIKVCQQRNLSLLLLPHVAKDIEALHALNELLMDKVNVYFQDELLLAPQLKVVVSQCHLVITGRMHLAIASLGQGTPICCIPYADKFEGLCEHFKLKNSVLNLKDFCKDPAKVLTERVEQLEQDKEVIKNALPKVKEMALLAFKH